MLALLAAAVLGAGACAPLPGVEALTGTPPHFVVVGEVHGTTETPAAFGELVCHLAVRGPVVVALEMELDAQASLDAFMASDGGVTAVAALLAQRHWREPPEGLSSRAMLALLQRLRALKRSSAPITVVAFVPNGRRLTGNTAATEAGMASNLERVAQPGATVLVLTGDGHARKARGTLATRLPSGALSLRVEAFEGGEAWNCRPEGCGPHPYDDNGWPAGLVLDPAAEPGFDGVLRLGVRTTASPPAVD